MKKSIALIIGIAMAATLFGCTKQQTSSAASFPTNSLQENSASASISSPESSFRENSALQERPEKANSTPINSMALSTTEGPQDIHLVNINFTVPQGQIQTTETATLVEFDQDAYMLLMVRKHLSKDSQVPVDTLIGALMMGNSGMLEDEFANNTLSKNKSEISVAGMEGYFIEGKLYTPTEKSSFTQNMQTKIILFKNGDYIYELDYFAPIDQFDLYSGAVQQILDSVKSD